MGNCVKGSCLTFVNKNQEKEKQSSNLEEQIEVTINQVHAAMGETGQMMDSSKRQSIDQIIQEQNNEEIKKPNTRFTQNHLEENEPQEYNDSIDKVRDNKKKKSLKRAFSESEQGKVAENISPKSKEKSSSDILQIQNSLKSHFIFHSLTNLEIENLLPCFYFGTTKAGEFLFKQGDSAQSFFLVESGEIQIIINGDVKKILGKGAQIGELALLYNVPRSASIKCIDDCNF